MRVEIVTFAKKKEPHLKAAEEEYLTRLRADLRIELRELSAAKGTPRAGKEQIRAQEAKALFGGLKEGTDLIVLDERGELMDSNQFAKLLESKMIRGTAACTFAIGGPEGWSKSVRERAQHVLALSPMTFPAHVARFLLIEQLYRAVSIIKGHPYHK